MLLSGEGRGFRQELGPSGEISETAAGRSLADVTCGHRLRKGSERVRGFMCVFWLEGALDLAQISFWHPNHLTARVRRVVPPWLNSILFGQSSLKRWPSFSRGIGPD